MRSLANKELWASRALPGVAAVGAKPQHSNRLWRAVGDMLIGVLSLSDTSAVSSHCFVYQGYIRVVDPALEARRQIQVLAAVPRPTEPQSRCQERRRLD